METETETEKAQRLMAVAREAMREAIAACPWGLSATARNHLIDAAMKWNAGEYALHTDAEARRAREAVAA